jgi:transketolase N-terminal domain/subunit
LIDLEILLAKNFGWSLYEIDNTDVESLIDFINRISATGGKPNLSKQAFCDEVDWL